MMENQQTTTKTVTSQTLPNASVEQEVISTSSTVASKEITLYQIYKVIWFVISLIELLIIARFILLLLGAANTAFVSLIYSLSRIFILPFVGIFKSPTFDGSYFDSAALIGIFAWIVIGFILTPLIKLFSTKE